MAPLAHLANWSGPNVTAQCAAAYNAYRRAKTDSYRAYFFAHRELRDEHHEYKPVTSPRPCPRSGAASPTTCRSASAISTTYPLTPARCSRSGSSAFARASTRL